MLTNQSTFFDRIAATIFKKYSKLCPSIQLQLIGSKVVAGFVLENVQDQSMTAISLATGSLFHRIIDDLENDFQLKRLLLIDENVFI